MSYVFDDEDGWLLLLLLLLLLLYSKCNLSKSMTPTSAVMK